MVVHLQESTAGIAISHRRRNIPINVWIVKITNNHRVKLPKFIQDIRKNIQKIKLFLTAHIRWLIASNDILSELTNDKRANNYFKALVNIKVTYLNTGSKITGNPDRDATPFPIGPA